jgi:hypothetical protein
VLIDPAERLCYLSVPQAMRTLQAEVEAASDKPARLIVPLPADLPSLFYMKKYGFSVPINAQPQEGETLWLLAHAGQTPDETLRSGLIQLPAWTERLAPWEKRQEFPTLTLYRSTALLPR